MPLVLTTELLSESSKVLLLRTVFLYSQTHWIVYLRLLVGEQMSPKPSSLQCALSPAP